MIELTQKCKRCGGSGEEVAGDGNATRYCPSCKALGYVLNDEVSTFIHALLRDDEIYHWIRELAKKLRADFNKS
jgi:DnaJ-class molecular chaperone